MSDSQQETVRTFAESKFPDTSQGPALQAHLPEVSLRRPALTFLCML